MAETEGGKKVVYVHPYKRQDGTIRASTRALDAENVAWAEPGARPPRPTQRRSSRRTSR
jgi:hypothetical protein